MITGKCNYNCIHCFNAADNAPLMSEWTMDEMNKLLDKARDCGINAFTITGGEPMLHKNFFEIIEGIYSRGIFVEELNTNGHFINMAALERLKSIGCVPLVKISFDGIGYHDWMRNHKGAEQTALEAISLCVENGSHISENQLIISYIFAHCKSFLHFSRHIFQKNIRTEISPYGYKRQDYFTSNSAYLTEPSSRYKTARYFPASSGR